MASSQLPLIRSDKVYKVQILICSVYLLDVRKIYWQEHVHFASAPKCQLNAVAHRKSQIV